MVTNQNAADPTSGNAADGEAASGSSDPGWRIGLANHRIVSLSMTGSERPWGMLWTGRSERMSSDEADAPITARSGSQDRVATEIANVLSARGYFVHEILRPGVVSRWELMAEIDRLKAEVDAMRNQSSRMSAEIDRYDQTVRDAALRT